MSIDTSSATPTVKDADADFPSRVAVIAAVPTLTPVAFTESEVVATVAMVLSAESHFTLDVTSIRELSAYVANAVRVVDKPFAIVVLSWIISILESVLVPAVGRLAVVDAALLQLFRINVTVIINSDFEKTSR